jgi:hypothetical protein
VAFLADVEPDTSISEMRRHRGLLRLSGAPSRNQSSANYTISKFEFDFRQGQVHLRADLQVVPIQMFASLAAKLKLRMSGAE